MTRISVDLAKCQGYANCLVEAPDHFDLDPDNKVVVLVDRFGDDDVGAVLAAVQACPARALAIGV